jgi:hypothetical protein
VTISVAGSLLPAYFYFYKPFLETMRHLLIVLIPVLGFVVGCGSGNPKTYQVTGVVTLDDKPVEGASISFVPTSTAGHTDAAAGLSDASGNYKLSTFVSGDGIRDGFYDIRVSKYVNRDGSSAEKDPTEEVDPDAPAERFEGYGKGTNPMTSAPLPKNVLPKKYELPTTSGLSFTVEKKAATYDIKLKSK